jgi:hypothetical protein
MSAFSGKRRLGRSATFSRQIAPSTTQKIGPKGSSFKPWRYILLRND